MQSCTVNTRHITTLQFSNRVGLKDHYRIMIWAPLCFSVLWWVIITTTTKKKKKTTMFPRVKSKLSLKLECEKSKERYSTLEIHICNKGVYSTISNSIQFIILPINMLFLTRHDSLSNCYDSVLFIRLCYLSLSTNYYK